MPTFCFLYSHEMRHTSFHICTILDLRKYSNIAKQSTINKYGNYNKQFKSTLRFHLYIYIYTAASLKPSSRISVEPVKPQRGCGGAVSIETLKARRQSLSGPVRRSLGVSKPNMLLLFETPAGFALFKVLDEGKLSKVEVLSSDSLFSLRFIFWLSQVFFSFLFLIFCCCRIWGKNSPPLTPPDRYLPWNTYCFLIFLLIFIDNELVGQIFLLKLKS